VSTTTTELGSVISLWRYPVKSMGGEKLSAARLEAGGVAGDHAFALRDLSDGKIASAKNPRKWPRLFDFRAELAETAWGTADFFLRVTLPDGTLLTGNREDFSRALSKALGRPVELVPASRAGRDPREARESPAPLLQSETYWPDLEGLRHRDAVTDFSLAPGTFFDAAPIHLLSGSTLRSLGAFHPGGRFEPARFRPNLLVEARAEGFPEEGWIGHTLSLGEEIRLKVTAPCDRCVMTTLAQGDLPADPGILRTALRHNKGTVGVYATVARGGTLRPGDSIRLRD
jgi:uncharacterized protein YcbX